MQGKYLLLNPPKTHDKCMSLVNYYATEFFVILYNEVFLQHL